MQLGKIRRRPPCDIPGPGCGIDGYAAPIARLRQAITARPSVARRRSAGGLCGSGAGSSSLHHPAMPRPARLANKDPPHRRQDTGRACGRAGIHGPGSCIPTACAQSSNAPGAIAPGRAGSPIDAGRASSPGAGGGGGLQVARFAGVCHENMTLDAAAGELIPRLCNRRSWRLSPRSSRPCARSPRPA